MLCPRLFQAWFKPVRRGRFVARGFEQQPMNYSVANKIDDACYDSSKYEPAYVHFIFFS